MRYLLRASRSPAGQRIRRRWRRRRAARFAGLIIALAAVALLFVMGSASTSTDRAIRVQRLPPRAAVGGRLTPELTQSQEVAVVRRLAAFGLPLFCGGRSKRMVALTFDDGPGVYTKLAIRKLRQYRLRATFFLVGKEIRGFPGLARLEEPVAAFGDHTMTHPFLPALAHGAMVQEIAGARTLIERAIGESVVLFRPPYEGRDRAIDSAVRALGLLEVLWNVDSQDSLGADYAGIERNVIAGLHPGSIILMHENRGQTIRALPVIFAALKRARLRAVTVPELVAADPPSLKQLRKGISGCSVSLQAGNGA